MRILRATQDARNAVIALISAMAIPLAACAANETADDAKAREVALCNNRFAYKLYDELKSDTTNVFFSPFSISLALGMTCAGASGNTATQMESVLGIRMPEPEFHAGCERLQKHIGAAVIKARFVDMSLANAIWMQKDFAFKQPFTGVISNRYGADLFTEDFASNPGAAIGNINKWVAAQTRGHIPVIVDDTAVDSLTRLVIVNAIYFKAPWANRFYEALTYAHHFTTWPAGRVPVKMMTQTHKFWYGETNGLQILDLPYIGGEFAMLVLLPRDADAMRNLESRMNEKYLTRLMSLLSDREVNVHMPKFSIDCGFSLKEALSRLGMAGAFDQNAADFSRATEEKIWIQSVLHKTGVIVNEFGTEAWAATSVCEGFSIGLDEDEPVVFLADHPFVFVIYDVRSGAILFLGKLVCPKDAEVKGKE